MRFAGDRALRHVHDREHGLLLRLGVAHRRQRVGRLARLGHRDADAAFGQRRRAVAELGAQLDLDRQARDLLEPVLGDHADVEGAATAGQRNPAHLVPVERQCRQGDRPGRGIEVALQRVADHRRLLVDFLEHEVAVIALAHHGAAQSGLADLALHLGGALVDGAAVAAHDDPVLILEVADALGERGQRQRVGADIHLAVAVADRQRAAPTRAHQKVVTAAEQHGERKGATQALHRRSHRLLWRHLPLEIGGDELGHHLGIRVAVEAAALGLHLLLQLLEVLDDAVVNDRDPVGRDRMGIALRGLAVRGPARVADADRADERLGGQPRLEVHQLALGPAPVDMAVHQGGDARRIVAAILESLQRVDQQRRDRRFTDDADDAAHGVLSRSEGVTSCRTVPRQPS
jgi:hypothetical protein